MRRAKGYLIAKERHYRILGLIERYPMMGNDDVRLMYNEKYSFDVIKSTGTIKYHRKLAGKSITTRDLGLSEEQELEYSDRFGVHVEVIRMVSKGMLCNKRYKEIRREIETMIVVID